MSRHVHLDVAARRAELTPHRPAVQWRGTWLDDATLNERASRLAGMLQAQGVRKGDRVAILAHNHIAHLDLILATAKSGAIYAPFNTRLGRHEQAAIGAYLRPALMLHDEDHADLALATGAPLRLLDDDEAWLGDHEPSAPPELVDDDIQMILLTGGTTGRPKGAMQPYRQGRANAAATVLSWGLRDDDVYVHATPAFHAAVNALAIPLLHLGGKVVWMERFHPEAYLHAVAEVRATLLFLVPTMYQMVAEHPGFANAALDTVRWAISGGAPCPDPVRRTFAERNVRFKQGYGLTEAGVNCFAMDLVDAATHPDAVGVPILGTRALVRHPDGRACAAGEVGELTLAGDHVFAGYFEQPDATREVLQDGWLWTGDLATKDDEGRFRIVGRRKELFISGGENIYPSELERLLHDHPAVAQAAVVGVPDARWGEVGLMAVVPRSDAHLDGPTLQAWLRDRVARFKVPKHVRIVSHLPTSGAGKVLKNELVRTFLEETAAMPTPTIRDHDVPIRGSLRVRVTEAGARSSHPVVLVHGNFASRRWWTDQLSAAPAGVRLIAIDLPNFGASDALARSPDLDAYAAALEATLDALDLEACALVGHSLGAAVVERLALRAPHRVTGMLLVDGPPPEGLPRPEEHYALLSSFLGQREMLAAALAPMAATRTPPYWDDLLDDALAMHADAYEGNARALGRARLAPAPADWHAPTIVLHGALDPLITPEMAAATAAHWPGATLECWPDVGHSPQIEAPERFNERLVAFAKEAFMT